MVRENRAKDRKNLQFYRNYFAVAWPALEDLTGEHKRYYEVVI